jgi:hypothetical protein
MNPLGLVIVTEYTSELPPHSSLVNRSNRNTQMFLDGRERRESEGPVIVIVQPDLRREVWFHTPTRTFTVRPIFELATPEEWRQWSKRGKRYNRQHAIRDQERVTYDVFIHTEKMNETTELFGFPARHYVTHRRDVYPESTHKEHESVSDGWYLDFLHPAMPEPSRLHKPGVVCSGNERPVIHRTGETPFSGLPAKVVTTGRQTYLAPEGRREHTSKHIVEIVSITEFLLDPVLFEIPEGYRERPVFPSLWSDVTKQFQTIMRRLRAA